MGEAETKAQETKERTVTLTRRQAVVDKGHLAGFAGILRFIADKIEEEIGIKPRDDGRSSAEPDV